MRLARTTRATLVAILLAAVVFGAAMLAHSAEQSDTEILSVSLDPTDPERTRVGELVYLGGLDIPPMGRNIGGLSGLRWDTKSGRLLAITDDARWVWMTLVEEDERLTGVSQIEVGNLLGLDGEPLTGKEAGDSESITRGPGGEGWMVGFERDHRVWRYADLVGIPEETEVDPMGSLGPLENNGGVETLAANERTTLMCVERQAAPDRPNCVGSGLGLAPGIGRFGVNPPDEIAQLGGVPTDADILADGTTVILFRSHSALDGTGAAIVAHMPDGTRCELATLRPPLTVDNFEGLALREEAGRKFLYIVSDDNFSSGQRTLLMKFELLLD